MYNISMKIYLATDHTGFNFKEELKKYLSEVLIGDYEIIDKGAFKLDKDDDYPDFVSEVAKAVAEDGGGSRGIILGGSGQGEAMCANRVKGVRTCVFYGQEEPKEEIDIEGDKSVDTFEIVKLAREHNDANVLSLGMRFLSEDEAKFAIELFLSTKFSNQPRHIRRINKF
jgi:ribose 5-phosphate isomerase B